MMKYLLKYRRPINVFIHLVLILLGNYLAFWLRFDGDIPDEYLILFWAALPWLIAIRGLLFIPFRLYEGLWRYTGLWDLRHITLSVLCSTPIFFGITRWGIGLTGYPHSVYIIDMMLLVIFLVGIRLARRLHHELGKVDRKKHVLIYGGGSAGEHLILSMRTHELYEPIGIIDDDRHKVGQRIHGIRILGTVDDLPKIIHRSDPNEIVIAIPSAEPVQLRNIVSAIEPYKIPIKTLPSLGHILDNQVNVSQLRDLAMEDILLRDPVQLDPEPVYNMLKGKRVLVTGAGGSIGSELCAQISSCEPEALILFERYENSLFAIMNTLAEQQPKSTVLYPVIGDITDSAGLDIVLSRFSPHIIFHAAAHKHVPLMEENPCEAVKNNIIGTLKMAEAAVRHQVDHFILISTDKAVNPTSIMGASKRVAEFIIKNMNQRNKTDFDAVRFGNVLGSNGSVIPTFLEQINERKPVTVTHPDIRRFFMSIPEAVSLILHAGAIGRGGDLFVLEMGEQIKMIDLARNLIRLAGLIPDVDVPIKFVGLRPGEKLFEELVNGDETVEPSDIDKINRIVSEKIPNFQELMFHIRELEHHAQQGDNQAVRMKLTEIVPAFQSHFPFEPESISTP